MKILTVANIDALVTLLKAFYLLSHLELRAGAWVASENVHDSSDVFQRLSSGGSRRVAGGLFYQERIELDKGSMLSQFLTFFKDFLYFEDAVYFHIQYFTIS